MVAIETLDAVVFDVDGTLCEYERGPAEMLDIAFERAGIEPFFTKAEYVQRYEAFIDESDTAAEHRERCFLDIAEEKDRDPEIARRVAQAYAAERDHENVGWIAGAREALDGLAGQYSLAAVTNGTAEMQSTKLDALGVECFETVVYAGFETEPKPDAEPFDVALDALGVAPPRALYVGNSLESDVAGAHNAGMPVAWLGEGSPESYDPEYTIQSPREILSILDNTD
jgi:putative hydrolase of the HAD superfamily